VTPPGYIGPRARPVVKKARKARKKRGKDALRGRFRSSFVNPVGGALVLVAPWIGDRERPIHMTVYPDDVVALIAALKQYRDYDARGVVTPAPEPEPDVVPTSSTPYIKIIGDVHDAR
jgi:hypothetical protein